MITYVNTVLVSNLATGAVLDAAPAAAASLNGISADAGKFIIMNCDPDVASNKLYEVTAANAAGINTIKIGIVTKKNAVLRNPNGTVTYQPIIKWSNEVKAADIKSYNNLTWAADTEDTVTIDFTNIDDILLGEFARGGKRIVVRLTFKDMVGHSKRNWTESYEYITEAANLSGATDAATAAAVAAYKAKIASDLGNMINKEWKRARVSANTATANKVILTALPYDDDDANETLNWYGKVRFNANIYYTDPAADGWESVNKHFPKGVAITKVPGKTYPATGKLVRDQESKAQGYLGILNRGEGTWPIIKPEIEANINAHYDAITLEFENMYRAADDIFRKTKLTVEVYGLTGQLSDLKDILDAFVDYKIED